MSARTRVVGYVRVSTTTQVESGAGMDAQRSAILREVEHRGWQLVAMHEDSGASGGNVNRPGLQAALAALDNGEADILCCAKIDRLSRSVGDVSRLLERYPRQLCILDLGVDLGSAYGEMVAHVVSAMAQLERRLVGERTAAALAEKRRQGVRLGRPRLVAAETVERIHLLRNTGKTYAEIAAELNRDGIHTPTRRGRWFPASVRRIAAWEAAA